MKNNLIILLIILFLPIYGYSYNKIDNKEYRLKEITKYISKENQIVSMVENYIFLTGDVNITSDKLIKFFELDKNFFKGINDNINLSLTNGILVLTNALQSKDNNIDEKTKELYNRYKNQNSYLKNNQIYIKLNENSKKAINFLKNLPDTYIVENNKNSNDININEKKLIYNGNGFKIKQFNQTTGKWQELGFYDLNNKKGIIVNNESDLIPLSDLKNINAYIVGNGEVKELHSTVDGWQSIDVATGDNFLGDGTIYDAACKIYNYDGGATITINPDKDNYIDSIQTFKKVEVTNENGYWVNDNNNLLIIKDISDTKYVNYVNGNVDNIFICSPNKENYYILNKENINGNDLWIIKLNSMLDMLNFNGNYMSGQWFYVEDTNIYFKKIDNIFYSKYKKIFNNNIVFTDYIVGAGTRDIFNNIILSDNKTYLTTLDDCSIKNNCSGTTTSIFGGEKINGLYKWNKINNSLEDVVSSSLSNAYLKGYSYFYDIVRNTYFQKVLDNNNNFCYLNINNNSILMENGQTLDNKFINIDSNIKIIFPLTTINCKNNLNNKYSTGIYKNYMNVNENCSFIKLNSLNDLKTWNDKSNIKNVVINNKLYTYNNQWQSFDTVFVNGDRNNLTNFDNGNDKLFYTTNIDDGDTYNHGFVDLITGLYVWEYSPNSDKEYNGFIDIYKSNSISDAYNNLSKIYKDFYINDNKFYKIEMINNNNSTYCIKDKFNNYLSSQNKIIPNEYIDNNQLYLPDNYNCTNVNISNNKVIINDFNDLKNFSKENIEFLYNNNIVKVLNTNNLLYSNNEFVVIGNRNDFNENEFKNFNFSNVYTTEDDSNTNNNINIIENDRIYKWEYYKDIDNSNSVNKLVEFFKPKNCVEVINVLHTDGINTIYDNNNNPLSVQCTNNGETILTFDNIKSYITFTILNDETKFNFDKNNLIFNFYNDSENELIMNFNIPITYNKIKLNNFYLSDSSNETQFSDDYKTLIYKTTQFNNFLNQTNTYFMDMLHKDDKTKTNYISIGVLDNNNIISELDNNNNLNETYFNSNNFKLEILFNNKDDTTNNLSINKNTTFSILP